MRTIAIPLTVFALLLVASSAEAQSTRATVTVDMAEDSIDVAPGEGSPPPGNATGNDTGNATAGGASVMFEVTVQAGGFLCTDASSYEVTLAASGGPDGVTATVEPANLTFDLRMNVYPSATSYADTQSAALMLSASDTAANGTGEVVVTASLSAGKCTPSTAAATADDSINVTVAAGQGNVTGEFNGTVDTNKTTNTGGELNETSENLSAKDDKKGGGIPGFEGTFVTVAVALAVAMVAARRRR